MKTALDLLVDGLQEDLNKTLGRDDATSDLAILIEALTELRSRGDSYRKAYENFLSSTPYSEEMRESLAEESKKLQAARDKLRAFADPMCQSTLLDELTELLQERDALRSAVLEYAGGVETVPEGRGRLVEPGK